MTPLKFHRTPSRTIALALVALLVASALPVAEAAGEPAPAGWSPADLPEDVRDIAVAKDARVLAVGNAAVTDRDDPDVGDTPDTPDDPAGSDFRAFDLESGYLFNASTVLSGTSAVAASRDGSAVVAGGATTNGHAVSFFTVPDAPEEDGRGARWRVTAPGPVAGIATNGDGTRVASVANAENDDGRLEGVLRVHDGTGTEIMEYRGTGRFTDVDVDATGRYIVVGGRHYEPGETEAYGALYLFRYGSETPLVREHFEPRNASEVMQVRVSADGGAFAAVTAAGELAVYKNEGRDTGRARTAGEPDVNLTGVALAMSDDGRAVAFSRDAGIRAFDFDGRGLSERWNGSLFTTVNALDMSGDGDVLVASSEGRGGGVYAFGPDSGQAFWRIAGAATHATLTADAEWVAYARGDTVHAARLEARVELLYDTGNGNGSTEPPATIVAEPFKPVTVDMRVSNAGSSPEDVTLELPRARHVSFDANRSSFHLVPGESEPVTITITPGRLTPGDYAFNATVVAGNGVSSNTTLAFTLAGTSDLAVSLSGPQERRVVPGANDSVLLEVWNNGNNVVNVSASVDQDPSEGEDWPTYVMGERTFTLAAGSRTTVGVIVEVPERAVNGSTNVVTLTLETPDGSTSRDVTYRVNPFLGVDVTADAGRTKYVYGPGNSETFNVTVKNRGSVPAQFAASYETRGSPNLNWVADVDVSPFTLEPGASRTMPVRVFAPSDGEPGDRATVLVEVRSLPTGDGLGEASGNVTLYVNLLEPLPDHRTGTEGRTIPAVGGILLLAAIGAATVIMRGRRER